MAIARLKLRRRMPVDREGVMNFLRNMAWVVPLTLLIWIYAEREQPTNNSEIVFPLHVRSADPSRLATLEAPRDGNVMVTVSGPKARLDAVREALAGGNFPKGLDVEVNTPTLGSIDWPGVALLSPQPAFQELQIKKVSPDVLKIRTENVREREVTVTLPADFPPMEAFTPTPRTVKLRGPESELVALQQRSGNGQLQVHPRLNRADLTPGVPQTFPDVPLEVPGIREGSRVTVTPDRVSVSLTSRRGDEVRTISLIIHPTAPRTLQDEYRLVLTGSDTIRNVPVRGPRDVVERLQRETADKPLPAILPYDRSDVTTGGRRKVEVNLPPGVTIDEKDRPEVEFRLVRRTAIE